MNHNSPYAKILSLLTFDKLAELTVNHFNTILGTNTSTHRLDVETPPSFVASTRKLFKLQWSHKKKRFLLHDMEVLTGKLGHISETAPWLKFLMSHLYHYIAFSLQGNSVQLVHTDKEYRSMIKTIKDSENLPPDDKSKTFAQSATARKVHRCSHPHNIITTLKGNSKLSGMPELVTGSA